MEVHSSVKWAPIVNQDLNIVALVELQRGTRELAIYRDHWPGDSGNRSVRPSQGNWEEYCCCRYPLGET
jgi:hypothetical protein